MFLRVFHGLVFAIRAGCAFDGERFLAEGATVVVDGLSIAGVESAPSAVPADCPVIDHRDATVLPGLVDTHVHLVGDNGPMALERVPDCSDHEIDTVVTRSLEQHLASGVTTVRDLGDRQFAVVDRRDAQRAHLDGLPWVVASGPPITSPGGHCFFLGGEVSSRQEIATAVRERVERGVDVVKVMASGGLATPGTDISSPQFSLDDLRFLVAEVREAGLPVTAHAHAAAGVDQAVEVGVDGIEHESYTVATRQTALSGLTNVVASDRQLSDLASSGIPVCPTMGGFTPEVFRAAPPRLQEEIEAAGLTPEQLIEIRMTLLGRMHRAGVRFVSGTDSGIAPPKAHGLFANAVIELAEVLPPAEVLATATSGAAAACGLGRSKGRLRTGYDADILVVHGDLARDLTCLRRVSQVVLRGAVVEPHVPSEGGRHGR